MADTRYPFTYACDLIRSKAGYDHMGTKLSRSDASQIRKLFAEVLGMDDVELANKLADYYQINEKRITDESARDLAMHVAYLEREATRNE